MCTSGKLEVPLLGQFFGGELGICCLHMNKMGEHLKHCAHSAETYPSPVTKHMYFPSVHFFRVLFLRCFPTMSSPGNMPQSFETPRRMLTPRRPLVWHRLLTTITAFECLGLAEQRDALFHILQAIRTDTPTYIDAESSGTSEGT